MIPQVCRNVKTEQKNPKPYRWTIYIRSPYSILVHFSMLEMTSYSSYQVIITSQASCGHGFFQELQNNFLPLPVCSLLMWSRDLCVRSQTVSFHERHGRIATETLTFSHLADAFIQSDLHMCDLQCIHILHLHWWHTAHQEQLGVQCLAQGRFDRESN